MRNVKKNRKPKPKNKTDAPFYEPTWLLQMGLKFSFKLLGSINEIFLTEKKKYTYDSIKTALPSTCF